MHEGDPHSFRFDLRPQSGELGDRLATERSTKMTKEYQEQRLAGRKFLDGCAGLRTVNIQQLGINMLGLRHHGCQFSPIWWGETRAASSTGTRRSNEFSDEPEKQDWWHK